MTKLLVALAMVGLTAAPALAAQCPLLIKQLNEAAGNRFDAAAATAKALTAEAEALHKAGKHADSVKKAEEAAKAVGVMLKMKQ
ncbi:MAG: hypothetical protein HY724_12640 [Candidatus Rokubacteria bacterium]|nr:hypothetical protein [Candidatus Rokubacteria bacterium]